MAWSSKITRLTLGCAIALSAGAAYAGGGSLPNDVQPNFADSWTGLYGGINGSSNAAAFDPKNSGDKSNEGGVTGDFAAVTGSKVESGKLQIEIGGEVDKALMYTRSK